MRIITRPDFDGIVCAALLREAVSVTAPILWVQPNEVQQGLVPAQAMDIVANLPYIPGCRLWFDHHVTNRIETPFEGSFGVAPSAARLIYDYYQERFEGRYEELLKQTDKIDSAELTPDEIQFPEKYPHLLLSMTVSGRGSDDEAYWNQLVEQITALDIESLMETAAVKPRCGEVIRQNRAYARLLRDHTRLQGDVAVTDFRTVVPAPEGNRFLVYSLFPQAMVQIKVRFADEHRQRIIIGIGHSIINRSCRVNVGRLLTRFGGGGHAGAGSCNIPAYRVEKDLPCMIAVLQANQPN